MHFLTSFYHTRIGRVKVIEPNFAYLLIFGAGMECATPANVTYLVHANSEITDKIVQATPF
jgi:hypothetical protein